MANCYLCVWFVCCVLLTSGGSGEVNSEDFHYFCDSNNDRGNYSTNERYRTNLNHVLNIVALQTSNKNGFHSTWSGEDASKVNAIAQCRGDVTATECRQCLIQSVFNLTSLCPNRKEAIGWYENEKCMLRYSDRSIEGLNEIGPAYFVWNLHDAPNPQHFNQVVKNLLDGLRTTAASALSARKYAASTATGPDAQLVYGLAQCTPDLSGPQCNNCLLQSIAEIPRCCNNRIGARILRPSCYVRYETDFPFYGPPAQTP
ncbi:cysteine-rich receptor-like protein kinase 26 [Cajanus cajan]|uniref:cysteine-rich receptor-like protein kinase 26 n=1 Tax=Cajanus cajan TaxID=3821 RepID=UPI00098DA0A9|nr:cysteine-rich receptor-like protein kinase 26 [Cajanus cajan]